ncbi:lysophospholipid acyltransferase family protein [Sansalvadorimonas verongulae]|uniref:lysophospholipid acyltransferase family protein n=1 Tax=Sansalvadorimonas verongulae TaxID=2172824 RepID=UPI0012BCA21C|nr:lysophospholipid acyltransferase family protein [Sansalvadorimonas verongulae]MTI14749.1 glycerol acyltransferase [Sansalvadorimonas verongulae]
MRITVFDTPVVRQLFSALAWLLLKLTGWNIEGQKPLTRRFVLIGAPHTSNWDFVIFMAVALRMRIPIYWLGKASLFKGPFGPIMRYLGGVAVHRERNNNLVSQAIAAYNCHPRFVLALAPEGTRSSVSEWKSGFWHIANGAKVPVVPAYVDLSKKLAGIGEPYKLVGDKEKDIANLQAFYAPYKGKRPGQQPSIVTNLKSNAKIEKKPL